MTQQSQKKWNVILNILLLINKKSGDNSLGELLIRVVLVKLVEELGGGQKTSGIILKHFLCCRWQLPYIWGHDPPRKWDKSRWLN